MNEQLKQGTDFYYDPNGLMVFTEAFLLKRGYCCNNDCRHCPYKQPIKDSKDKNLSATKGE